MKKRLGVRIRPARSVVAGMIGIVVLILGSTMYVTTVGAEVGPESDLSHYDFEVSFDPRSRTLAGSLELDWRNDTEEAQDVLYFRLYPNAEYYAEGGTTVSNVSVDGRVVESQPHRDPTVLEVPIGHLVEPGNRAEVVLTFETIVPTTSDASLGMLGGDDEEGWWLADWHPILAGWEDGSGWYLAEPTRFGDPTFADSATYDLTLTAPDSLDVLGSGVVVSKAVDTTTGVSATVISSAPGRDLTLSLLPDRAPGMVEMEVQEIAGFDVRVSLPQALAIPGLGDAIIRIAADTLPLFEEWLGEYPDGELEITSAPLAGARGVAWNGIIWLDLESIATDGQVTPDEEERLRFVLTHELSHQWISGIVGSNNNDHGFMSEGLANIVSILAIRERFGAQVADAYLRDWVAGGYRGMVANGEDGIADAAITDDTDIAARSHLIYGKGALGFEAIRQSIGDDAYFAALEAYATGFRFAISEPGDLKAAFESASGADISDLWIFWFLDDTTTLADIDSVLNGFATN